MTRRLMIATTLAATFALTGCGGITPDKSTETEVSGTVTNASGAPVKDVELMFQPVAGTARQANFVLKADGKFAGTMTTGKYTYSFQELPGKASAFNAIPNDYKRGTQDRVVEVAAGQPLDIKVK